jgi:transcriptional regulator with XRE-family HTH domain
MTPLATNLTARREKLGLTVPEVHAELNRRGFPVAFSTVAGWFNGSRGVRKMDHLKALCAILQTDLDSLTKDEIEIAEGPVDATVVREIRELTPAQREAVLALIRSMRGAPA